MFPFQRDDFEGSRVISFPGSILNIQARPICFKTYNMSQDGCSQRSRVDKPWMSDMCVKLSFIRLWDVFTSPSHPSIL